MPFGNGMGPNGMGPMSGRGMGYCAGNNRPGRFSGAGRGGFGRGRGFGFRSWFGGNSPREIPEYNESTVRRDLESEAEYLRQELQALEERIAKMKKAASEK